MTNNKYASIAAVCLLFAGLFVLTGYLADADTVGKDGLGNGLQPQSTLPLEYAKNFAVDYYKDGYALITLSDKSRYLVVGQGCAVPEGIDEGITVLKQPIDNIYLVATSAMCLFDALDALNSIRFSGTAAENWYIPNAKAAMVAGDILYAGKYSAPDYELILSGACSLAVESSMINYAPQVKETLQSVGIPVLVDQSSYEPHPLGRTEWIKLYGLLLGKEAEANRLFDEQAAHLKEAVGHESTGKTVAFFYITSSGQVVARKPGDYVTKMIELAGGHYIFKDLGDPDSAMSTAILEMEKFYATAKDADFIIYNSTVGGEVASLSQLVEKNSLLKDFKAVQNGDVWCTGKNLFQETTQHGLMISDIRKMLTNEGKTNALNFLFRLQ